MQPKALLASFEKFSREMRNRLIVGHYRYGSAHPSQKYFSRLKLEVKAYVRTGNCEHLRNIANYAFLESFAPEHPKYHDNPHVQSATRREVSDVEYFRRLYEAD